MKSFSLPLYRNIIDFKSSCEANPYPEITNTEALTTHAGVPKALDPLLIV